MVLSYDLGNGLTIERGGEIVEQVARARRCSGRCANRSRAIKWIGSYLRYLGNLRAARQQGRNRRRWP